MLGPPASGKGTHGKSLASQLGVTYLSTGALLRQQVQGNTRLGQIAAPILEQGLYLPDGVMCDVIDDWLRQHPGGWVLDGFPRSEAQAKFLDDRLAAVSLRLDAAVALQVTLPELRHRIAGRVECPACHWSGPSIQSDHGNCPDCGRAVTARPDDHEENFLSRHREFERLTLPAIDYYRRRGCLLPLDASGSRDAVAARLRQCLESGFVPGLARQCPSLKSCPS